MTTPPSRSSGSSSYISSTTSNEVPEEYLITSTSSLPPLSTQSFPFPPQNASSSSSMPTTKPRNLPWNPQHHSPSQPPQATTKAAPPGPSDHQASSSSSTARLLHEQRLSTCLNILRHVQRTLRQRHDEATAHLTHTTDLVAQSTWDLFYQSPLDYMCHEMDMLTDETTNAILSDKSPLGIGSSTRGKLSTAQESEAWMKKLDELRDLRDDEDEIKQRVDKIARQMETAKAMMRVGTAEQGVVLARSDALLPSRYRYQYIYQNGLGQPPTMCVRVPLPLSCRNEEEGKMKGNANNTSTKKTAAPVPKSSFFNWPVPATLSKGKQVAVESEGEESSGTNSQLDSPRECQGECCRHLTS
ncbi:hypothetical protein TgHK011_007530 [Trichoderma gracile]|nr:hypothetical protein TgHK011_007530 [Trichoderma gracile]